MRLCDDIAALFDAHLPARGSRAGIALAPGEAAQIWIEDGLIRARLMLVVYDAHEPDALLDVKEQQIWLARSDVHDPARVRAFVEGHLRALPALLDRLGDRIDKSLPVDVIIPQAIADVSLTTADDFAEALGDRARVDAWEEAAALAGLEEELATCGLAGHAAAVRALASPSVRLRLERNEDDDAAVRSRIGGAPDLPADVSWPEVGGMPLMFVGQIDLSSVSADLSALPATGLLSFFYHPDGDAARVLYFAEAQALLRRAPPANVAQIVEHQIEMKSERMFPPSTSPHYEALLPDGESSSALAPLERLIGDWQDVDYDAERPMHRLLGYASSIQGDPYVDLEGDGSGERARARTARRWQLLLQIDVEDYGEPLIDQDGGFLYFWIPSDALAVHDWTAVRASTQCH